MSRAVSKSAQVKWEHYFTLWLRWWEATKATPVVSKLSAGHVFSTGLHKFAWSHRKLKLKVMVRAMHDILTAHNLSLKCSQAAPSALNGNFLRQQKEQRKRTNCRSTRFHVVSSWALRPAHQETLLLSCSTRGTTSTLEPAHKGQLLSSPGGNFTSAHLHFPESSFEKLLTSTAATESCKDWNQHSHKAHRLLGLSVTSHTPLSSSQNHLWLYQLSYQILVDIKAEKVTFCFGVTPQQLLQDLLCNFLILTTVTEKCWGTNMETPAQGRLQNRIDTC